MDKIIIDIGGGKRYCLKLRWYNEKNLTSRSETKSEANAVMDFLNEGSFMTVTFIKLDLPVIIAEIKWNEIYIDFSNFTEYGVKGRQVL